MQRYFDNQVDDLRQNFPHAELVEWQPSGLNRKEVHFISIEIHREPYYERILLIDVGDGVYSITHTTPTLADLRNPNFEGFFSSIRLEPVSAELLKSYDAPPTVSEALSAKVRVVAEKWLHQLYQRNFEQAERGLSILARRDRKKKDIQAMLEPSIEGTDPAVSVTRKFLHLRSSYLPYDEGGLILYYESIAANKERVLEAVLMCLDPDKQWRVLDYESQEREGQSLEKELARINADSALVLPFEWGVDRYPLWSPEGDYIASRVNGSTWYKVNLNALSLEAGEWKGGKKIGIIRPTSLAISPATMSEITSFGKQVKYHPREVMTRDETKIELKQKGFSTSLTVTRKGQAPKILWSSELENCHSLNLSPNEKNVAFLCERSGVAILNLDQIP